MKKKIIIEKVIDEKVTIKYEITKKGIKCFNHHTIKYVWGSKIGSTDMCNWYGVERGDGYYFIPLKVLKIRKKVLDDKLDKVVPALSLINRILKVAEK